MSFNTKTLYGIKSRAVLGLVHNRRMPIYVMQLSCLKKGRVIVDLGILQERWYSFLVCQETKQKEPQRKRAIVRSLHNQLWPEWEE